MTFSTILMDPPWNERGGGKIKRGADRHYGLVKTRDMPDVIHGSGLFLPAEHAHLWMWATNNYLPDALWLIDQLGFTYKTNAVWVKTGDPVHELARVMRAIKYLDITGLRKMLNTAAQALALQIGLGQYLRGSHELLLFAVRGKGQHESVWNGHRDVPSVIRARRTKHSRKPVESYHLIERVSKPARVEFFARSERPGWVSWGDEAPK